MTTNNAPVPNFSSIDFNDAFFSSTSGAYVNYPTAQGTVSFPKLLAGEIDSTTPAFSNNMFNTLTGNLNLATNGLIGQTLRVGAYTGASVQCASIDHTGNSINHATNASGGTLNLANNMTSGTLNIGTNTARSGNINLGNGAGASGYINIGSSTAGTQVGGTLLSTGQITATAGLQSVSGAITTGGNISTTGSGTITSAGLITATSGISSSGAITTTGNISTTGTGNITSAGLITGPSGILSGNSAFGIISATYTIPSTINRDFYLFCNASGTAYTITLPARLQSQYIRFRNYSGQTLTITAPTTTPATAIYPSGSTTAFTTTWTGFLNNTVLTLYCDGNNWLGF